MTILSPPPPPPPSTNAPPPPHHLQQLHHHHHHHLLSSHPQHQRGNHHHSSNYSHSLRPHQQYPSTLDSRRPGTGVRRANSHNAHNKTPSSHTLPRQNSMDFPKGDMGPLSHSFSSRSSPSGPPSHTPPLPRTKDSTNPKHRTKGSVNDPDPDFHSGNSVVSQTKPDSSEASTTRRKRKKPGQDPEAPKPPPTGPKDNGVPSPPDDDKQTFYENLPFHGMQPPPNKDTLEGQPQAGGSRPPSQLSQQASSGYGSTRSRKDLNMNQSSADDGAKDPHRSHGRKDVSFHQDVDDKEDEKNDGFNTLRRQNSESYGSMRSTAGKPAKGALARTAAYFSMRLPRHRRKSKNKDSSEENHQMIHKCSPIKAVPSKGCSSQGPSSFLGEAGSDALPQEPQTTQFTTETKHTVTSQPVQNTVIFESSQTSKVTLVTRPQSRTETDSNSVYADGLANQTIPNPGVANKVSSQEQPSDERTYDVTGTTDALPTPAPRNGGNGRVKHTYQNIPLPTTDQSKTAQPHVLPENRKTTANYGSAQHQNPTPSSSSSSSSPSSYPYQPQYQPHYQRNPSLYKQYPSSSSLNQPPPPYHSTSSRQSYSSSTYPHPVESQSHPATSSYPNTKSPHPATTSYPSNQSHPATSYPQTINSQSHLPKYTPGVVYADLTLSRNGHPNTYRRDLNTEYAILQFNGPIVGQEIDV